MSATEHCVHWSNGEACCRCGEPACPSCDENGCIDDARCPEWGKTYAQAAACVPVIAGASGSGKSLSLARMAERFTRKHPDSPVRILDAGRSAEPLADL